MWKRIISLFLAAVFFVFVPLLGGCEDKKSDTISVEKHTTATDIPIGERTKLTGD